MNSLRFIVGIVQANSMQEKTKHAQRAQENPADTNDAHVVTL